MKNIFIYAALCGLLAACHATDKQTVDRQVADAEIKALQEAPPSIHNSAEDDVLANRVSITELVPLALLRPEDSNVYSKYGIDFEGNCYSCDLAELTRADSSLQWINVCDKNDVYTINGITVRQGDKQWAFKTAETTFIFTEIDDAPVYELTIEGKTIELENKRIAKYFSPKGIITKFDLRDCGDFDG